MTTPDTSASGPELSSNNNGIVSVEQQEARLLTPEELRAMFNPKATVGGKEFSFDLGYITGTVNTEEELNNHANLRIGNEFTPRKDWKEEQMKKIVEFRQNLSSGSQEEQKLAEEINNFQKFVNESRDFYTEIQSAMSDPMLGEEDREERVLQLGKLREAQEIEERKRLQYLGSLFRDIAKLPKITQGGVDQFLDLPENQKIRAEHIADFASNFKYRAYHPETIEAAMQSRFLDEVPEGEIREAYESVKYELKYVYTSDAIKEDEKLQQELIKLDQFKLFLEKKFPYLVVAEIVESPLAKERSVMDRLKSIGTFISNKWNNLTNRPATEIIPEQVEPKLDAIIPEVKIDAEASTLKVSDEAVVTPSAESDLVTPALTSEETEASVIPEAVEVPVEAKSPAGLPSWYRVGPLKKPEPVKPELASVPAPEESATVIKPEEVVVAPVVEAKIEGDTKVVTPESVEEKKAEPVSPEKKKAALERIWKKIEQSPEWYNKQPTKVKLAVSATLIVAGLAGAALSSGMILGGVATAKYALRASSAFMAAKGVGNMLEGKSYARKAMLGTFLGTFALGSYSGDILKSVGGTLLDLVPNSFKDSLSILNSLVTNELKPVQEELTQKLGSIKDEVVERFNTADKSLKDWRESRGGGHKLAEASPNGVLPTDVQPTKPPLIPQAPASAPVAVDTTHPASAPIKNSVVGYATGVPASSIEHAVGSGVEQLIEISSGDTLSEVMMDNIGEKFPGFDDLTPKGQANFIYNILSNLKPEQLKEIGVSSMNADTLSLNDKIDFNKLHDIAKDMKITYGGQEISFFERAKLLK